MSDSSIAFQIGSLTVKWYGVIIVLGMIMALITAYKLAKRRNLDPEELINIALVVIPTGVIGARLYYVILEWENYSQNLGAIFKIWNGGLAIHGALIAAILGGWLYTKIKKQPFFAWADVIIPGVALAQAIGRWGNYFNQEAHGYETDLSWGIEINGINYHPTFLYESLWDFGVFIFLIILLTKPMRRHPYREGYALAWYMILYSIGRFFIEGLRTDSLMIGPFRMAQIVSIILFILGIIILIRRWKIAPAPNSHRKKKKK